jgi:hypothetical protein
MPTKEKGDRDLRFFNKHKGRRAPSVTPTKAWVREMLRPKAPANNKGAVSDRILQQEREREKCACDEDDSDDDEQRKKERKE